MSGEKERGDNNTVKDGGGGQQSEKWDQQRKDTGNLSGSKDKSKG